MHPIDTVPPLAPPGSATFLIGIVGALAAWLGPLWAQILVIAFGSLIGSTIVVSRVPMASFWAAIRFILVGILLAWPLTGLAMWAGAYFLSIPEWVTILPAATIIGVARNQVIDLISHVIDLAGRAIDAVIPVRVPQQTQQVQQPQSSAQKVSGDNSATYEQPK